MFRKTANGWKNKSFFRSTHDLTKKVNVNPYVPRGGIRF